MVSCGSQRDRPGVADCRSAMHRDWTHRLCVRGAPMILAPANPIPLAATFRPGATLVSGVGFHGPYQR
ncbi:protein of unknown function [Methylorubrum extorquens DM4]|uniref:Uncharacterized protein n=1 Tax=Methylorubrum extorquens (strain DSM 6343 / CIP 106787 / DM4) TaxID=661410 RepID=C7C9Z6_METED|nr:protein of unknown function [Methylorubrum extorquens DM4]